MQNLSLFPTILACLAIAIPESGRATCTSYLDSLVWLSTATVSGRVNAAVLDADLLYVARGCAWTESCAGWLDIYDVSDAENPVPLSSLALPGSARDLVVLDGVAYVAEGQSGLVTVDVSTPNYPSLLAEWGSADGQHIEVTGDLAYLLSPTSLTLLNVSDPALPVMVGSIAHGGTGMAVGQDHAFILPGLTVVDISNPEDPVLVVEDVLYGYEQGSPSPPPGDPLYQGQALLDGDLLYTAYCVENPVEDTPQASRTRVLDVSDPASPVPLGYTRKFGAPAGVRLVLGESEVFTNLGWVNGNAQPEESLLASLTNNVTTLIDTGSWDFDVTELCLRDDELWVFTYDEVHRFHAGTLGGEERLGGLYHGTNADLLVQGDYAYGVSYFGGSPFGYRFQVYDVSDASDPTFSGGFFGFPSMTAEGLRSLDSNRIAWFSTYWVEDAFSEISVLDISTPDTPTISRMVLLDDIALRDLVVHGGYGYAVGRTVPGTPTHLIEVLDLDALSGPMRLNTIDMSHALASATVHDGRLITIGSGRATVLSLDDPVSPLVLSETRLGPFVPRSVLGTPDALYIVARKGSEAHLLTFEIEGASTLSLVNDLRILRTGTIRVSGDLLAIGGNEGGAPGIDHFDISTPSAPVPIVGFRDRWHIDAFFMSRGKLYTTASHFSPVDPEIHLSVYDLPCYGVASTPTTGSTTLTQARVWPNPATATQRLEFRLPAGLEPGSRVDSGAEPMVRIFDATGRLVRSIPALEEGEAQFVAQWDGRNERGESVPAGVYGTRLEYQGRVAQSSLLRIR